MKNNIGYFTHEVEASEHRKFLILRTHYGEGDKGWAMEGRFWRLNSLIGKADNCRLDTNLKGEKARIAHDLGIGLKDLDEFLTVLEAEAELIHNENGVIWTDQTQEDLARAMATRKGQKARRNSALPNNPEKLHNETEKPCNENDGVERSRVDRRGEEHTQEARVPEPPVSKNPTDSKFHQAVHERWSNLVGVPKPPEFMHWIMGQDYRDFLEATKGYHSSDVLGAIENFAKIIADPGSYWISSRPSLKAFFRGEVFQACRPGVFPAAALKDPGRGEGPEVDPERAKYEAEMERLIAEEKALDAQRVGA